MAQRRDDPSDPLRSPDRRRFLGASGALAAGALWQPAGAQPKRRPLASNHARGSRPNILLMLVDEMRYPPIYEGAAAKQFRDRYLLTQKTLRETGVEFHRHYAAATACAPSRSSIFTGQYPSLHGVTQTTGAAKEANDPDVFWLDPNGVPTMGDWFRAAGYRTYYRGKWHVSNADLQIPGTHDQIVSYDAEGQRDPAREALYQEADRLGGYGFEGWIGPEPHGKAPLNTGSSAAVGQGRDQGFASQCVDLIQELDRSSSDDPFLMVASFVNPHDIALWGYFARTIGVFDFTIDDVVPRFEELFEKRLFDRTLEDDLDLKPSCQSSYQESYHEWMQGIPPEDYFRLYYQLHKNVDEELFKVYQALEQSSLFQDTVVVFTSDHGDLLGSHRYMHQKWYQVYDEAVRVPLIVSSPGRFPAGESIHRVTSHVDLLPTLLGIAGADSDTLLPQVAAGHTDTQPLVGRDLTGILEQPERPASDRDGEPIYFMTDDDPSRGLDQENVYGIAYDSVTQPNHIESVIVELNRHVWKLSRYFDNEAFWTDPDPGEGVRHDVVLNVDEPPGDPPGQYAVPATQRVKYEREREEFEMYDVTRDPMELRNLAGHPGYARIQARLTALLEEQRQKKRLTPGTAS